MRIPLQLIFALAFLTSSFVWAQEHHQQATPGQASTGTSSSRAFEALMKQATARMHAAMAAVPTTGQPDRDFLTAMIPHHQGAIDMAKAVLLTTTDRRIRNLAQSIITEQQYEIELMKTLLAENPATVPREKQQ